MMWGAHWLYVHIPRTSGTLLKLQCNSTGVSRCMLTNKHATASQCIQIIGQRPREIFTIMRHPWDIVCSWYFVVKAWEPDDQATRDWKEYATHVQSLSLNEFIKLEVLSGNFVRRGGFISHYCDAPGVRVLTAHQARMRLTELTGIEFTSAKPFTRYKENRLTQAVLNHCQGDKQWLYQNQ